MCMTRKDKSLIKWLYAIGRENNLSQPPPRFFHSMIREIKRQSKLDYRNTYRFWAGVVPQRRVMAAEADWLTASSQIQLVPGGEA